MAADPTPDLEALLAEEPFVRSLARALARGDADEVVQQTWLSALQHEGPVDRPRSWLARIVRNVAANLRRGDRRRGERERDRAAGAPDRAPSSAELMLREERRRALVCAVDALPAPLREVVLLRWFEGLPPRRIAAVLGVPVTTVWNRLRSALQLLRARLQDEHGDVRAWLAPVALGAWPTAAATAAAGGGSAAGASSSAAAGATAATGAGVAAAGLAGGLAMTTKTKVAAALAAAAVLVAFLVVPRSPQPPAPAPTADGTVAAQQAVAHDRSEGASPAMPDLPAHRETVATPAPATTGSLLVRVVREADRSPAAGEVLLIGPQGVRELLYQSVRTNGAGEVLLESLAPGRFLIGMPQTERRRGADLRAGERCELEYVIPTGVTVRGIVVDAAGRLVPGAEVAVSPFGSDTPRVMARTAADGTFEVRDVDPRGSQLGARAPGFAASRLQMVLAPEGGEEWMRIQLLEVGGAVAGTVRGPDGEPVGDAIVRVGIVPEVAAVSSIGMTPQPLPAVTTPDGAFRVLGLAVGEHPVLVRSARFAGWTGTCVVAAGGTTTLPIVLSPGVTCTGIVRREDGALAEGAFVDAGRSYDSLRIGTMVAADGRYTLTGVTPGSIPLRARDARFGVTEQTVQGRPGETVTCDLVLSRGHVLRGRVLDDAGAAAAGVLVEASASSGWSHLCATDETGRFELGNCPADQRLQVTASRGELSASCETFGVQKEVELRLPPAPERPQPSVRIRGRVLEPGGAPAAGMRVLALDPKGERVEVATDAEGMFALPAVRPGSWQVQTGGGSWPWVVNERRDLVAEELWDVGDLQLVAGGTARIQVLGAPPGAEVAFRVRHAHDGRGFGAHWLADGWLRIYPVPAGDYVVRLSCPERAPCVVAFSVREGEETPVVARLEPGVRQLVRLLRVDGVLLTIALDYELHRGDGSEVMLPSNCVFVARPAEHAADGAVELPLWLPPGEYRVTAREREFVGSATFTVGASEGPPVRVVLQ